MVRKTSQVFIFPIQLDVQLIECSVVRLFKMQKIATLSISLCFTEMAVIYKMRREQGRVEKWRFREEFLLRGGAN